MLLDCRECLFDISAAQITEWANRRLGIGFDQLIVVELQGGDLAYRFFNADGGEAEQCGNGQRAIAHYLHHNGVLVNDLRLRGLGGDVVLNYKDEDHVSVTFNQTAKVEEQSIMNQI